MASGLSILRGLLMPDGLLGSIKGGWKAGVDVALDASNSVHLRSGSSHLCQGTLGGRRIGALSADASCHVGRRRLVCGGPTRHLLAGRPAAQRVWVTKVNAHMQTRMHERGSTARLPWLWLCIQSLLAEHSRGNRSI